MSIRTKTRILLQPLRDTSARDALRTIAAINPQELKVEMHHDPIVEFRLGRLQREGNGKPHHLPSAEWGNQAGPESRGPRRDWSRNK